MVDALDSKSGDRKVVGVRVPFRAQQKAWLLSRAFFMEYGMKKGIGQRVVFFIDDGTSSQII